MRRYIHCFIAGLMLVLGFTAPAQTLPVPSHIVILFEENLSYSEIIGSSSAPHINAIAADTNAAVFTQFHAIEHPSQPNYIDIFSGSNQGVTDDSIPIGYPFTAPNLCAELLSVGKTFTTWSENLPSAGYDGATYTAGSADYARKHNPCTNWVGTGANQYTSAVNQPFTALPASYNALPTVSFVVPNLNNDMHNYTCTGAMPLPCPESIRAGDTWEYNNMDSLRRWSLANNTLYIIIYDEDDDYHDNNIPVIFYGPMVRGGVYNENVNHYNLLRTIEDMYSLGHAGAATSATSIIDCWKTSVTASAVSNITADAYNFIVIPNPASDRITFSTTIAIPAPATIHITDEAGHTAGIYSMSGNALQVSAAALAAGIYVYQVIDGQNNLIGKGKFVIAHK